MKLKNISITSLALLSLGTTMAVSKPASASSWHYGALPSKIQGTWYSNYRNATLKIYNYNAKFGDSRSGIHITRWRYSRKNFLVVQYKNPYGDNFLIHYFNSHKLSASTFDHSYHR